MSHTSIIALIWFFRFTERQQNESDYVAVNPLATGEYHEVKKSAFSNDVAMDENPAYDSLTSSSIEDTNLDYAASVPQSTQLKNENSAVFSNPLYVDTTFT